VFPAGMLAVTLQLPGLLEYSVWCQPEIGLHTSLLTVGSELVPSICASLYGPQEPLASLVVQEAVGVEAGVVLVGLGEADCVGAGEEGDGAGEEGDGAGEEGDGAGEEGDGVADGLVDVGEGDGAWWWWWCVSPDAMLSCGVQPAEATAMAAAVTATAAMVFGLDSMIMNSCLS
jgi:hypothetical protein